MERAEFAFNFPDVHNKLRETCMVNRASGREIRFSVGFNDSQFARLAQNPMPAYIADLVDIAFAVAVADRLAVPHADQQRLLDIALPVRDPTFLSAAPIIQGLQDLLHGFTGDEWRWTFEQRITLGRSPERERRLLHGVTRWSAAGSCAMEWRA